MTVTDPLDVLLALDRWASANLIDACRALDEASFHRQFEMGRGSLHDTIAHVLGSVRGWTDVLQARPEPRVRLEEGRYSIDELSELASAVADEFEVEARAGAAADVFRPSRRGVEYAFTRGGIVTHVATHGVHHRAQCLNMLRQLGIEPLPPVSGMEWMLTEGRPADA